MKLDPSTVRVGIRAKFPGACKRCGERFMAGEWIVWKPVAGVIRCPSCNGMSDSEALNARADAEDAMAQYDFEFGEEQPH